MRKVAFVLAFVPALSFAQVGETSGLGDRANVMECSHDEVVAYMDLPDPGRKAMSDYYLWQAAYQSTEVKKAEDDPSVCLGLLYGDLSALGDKVSAATNKLMSMSLPSLSDVASKLTDKLKESVCSRVQSGADSIKDAVMDNVDTFRRDAENEVVRKYGIAAMENLLTDAVIPPDYQSMGLRYRNGELSKDTFRNNVSKRWEGELDDLQDDAVDSIQ